MVRPNRHWAEDVIKQATSELAEMKAIMRQTMAPVVLRRPDTSDMVKQAIADPSTLEPQGRARLGKWARQRYGEAASLIYPYLGLDENGQEVE